MMLSPRLAAALLLTPLKCAGDIALLMLRILVGAFLVWGVADNIVSAERLHEFEGFLARFGFAYPAFMARLSVWGQFWVGLAFILGFMTRWAGIICVVNFIVAIVMVDGPQGIRAAFPAACLVVIGMYLATHGAGRISIDRRLEVRAGAKNSPA